MPDILISYSRRNKDFVEQLHKTLADQGFDIWVDWEDIPLTADWWREIRDGIESSDSFVFVLSKASMASAVCAMEISHAIACNKQFIPVVYETVNIDEIIDSVANAPIDPIVASIMDGQRHVDLIHQNWQKVGRHNWLFFNDPSDFEQNVERLISAIRTDLEHVRTHTRLLLRAREWDFKGRVNSLLLTGTEIIEAEQWLSESGNKEPKPTQLHTEYLLASRAHQRKQLRNLLALVSVGLLTVAVLAVLSFFLYQQAEANYQRADLEARIAYSGRTAVQSLIELNQQNTDIAFLLSLAAFDIYDNRESRSSILTALQRQPQLEKIIYDHQAPVRAVDYAPDSNIYVTADEAGVILIWQDETLIQRLESPSEVWDVALSPDGTRLVAGGRDGTIYQWDTNTYQSLPELVVENTTLYSLDFYRNVLAAGYSDGLIRLWDTQTHTLLTTLEGHADYVHAVKFNPDGTLLASGSADQQIFLWDVSDLQGITMEQLPYQTLSGHTNWVWSLDFSPDGNTLASGGADSTLRLWDVASASAKGQPITDHSGWVRAVQFSPDGQQLATASSDQTMILRNAQNGRRLTAIAPLTGHADEVFDFAYMGDTELVSVGEDTQIMLWATQPQVPLNNETIPTENWYYQLALSPDGEQLLGAGDSGTVLLRDLNTGEVTSQQMEDTQILSVAWHPSNGSYAYVTAEGKVVLVSGEQQQVLVEATGVPLRTVAFSPDGQLLTFAGEDQQVYVWNILDVPEPARIFAGHEEPISSLTFTSDSQQLVSGDFSGNIIVWNVASGEQIETLSGMHTDTINRLQISHNGDLLASASRDNTLILWDTTTWEASKPLVGHADWVLDVAFNANDTLLASGGRDQNVILWDVATRQAIGEPLSGHEGWVWAVVFDSTQDSLISSDDMNIMRLWNFRITSWQQGVCAIVNRNLTEEEWQRFLSLRDYEPSCDDDNFSSLSLVPSSLT